MGYTLADCPDSWDHFTGELDQLAPSYERAVAAAEAWRDSALAALDPTKAGYEAFAADIEEIYQGRIAKAREDDLERHSAWAAGIQRGFESIRDSANTWADVSEELITGWAKGGEEAFVTFAKTGKTSLEGLVDFTLEQISRLAFQQFILPGLNGVFNTVASALGGALGGGAGVTMPTAHSGGRGVMRSYSAGNTPRPDERLAMLRDGEEVFTPRMLENAGTIVSMLSSMSAQGAGTTVVDARPVIQVVNQSRAAIDAEVEETTDARGQRQYRLVMSDMVAAGVGVPGGAAQKTMGARFGIRPQGRPRG